MSRGTIARLPSGRYRVRVPSGRGQISWGTFDTRAEAERELVKALQVSDATRRDYEGLTVAKLGDKIMTRREVKKEVRDPGTDRSRWDNHVKHDEIGRIAVTKLQPKHVHLWLARLRDKGLAPQTIRNCRNLLSVVMSEACQHGLVHQNPLADVRLRAPKVSTEAGWTYLVPDEQIKLMLAVPYPERLIVAFAIGTGLRAGELAALRRVDVDVEGQRLMVRYGGPPDEPTKTGRVRQLPLLGPAREAALAWIRDVPARPDSDVMFPLPAGRSNRYGTHRDPNHIVDWTVWKSAIAAAGITRRLRWHDLRHTCASSLVSGWWGRRWSLQEVKEMLGHTTIDITQRYAHLAPGALEEAARATPGRRGGGQDTQDTAQAHVFAAGVGQKPSKQLAKQVAPPAEIESATFGLGSHCERPDTAPLLENVLSVTCVGSEHPVSPISDHQNSRPPSWVHEASANLLGLLAGVRS